MANVQTMNPLNPYSIMINDIAKAAAKPAYEAYYKSKVENQNKRCKTMHDPIQHVVNGYVNSNSDSYIHILKDVSKKLIDMCNTQGIMSVQQMASKLNEDPLIKGRLQKIKNLRGGTRKSKNKRTRKTRRHRRSARHS